MAMFHLSKGSLSVRPHLLETQNTKLKEVKYEVKTCGGRHWEDKLPLATEEQHSFSNYYHDILGERYN